MNLKEKLQKLNDDIKSMMTKETSDEQLSKFGSMLKDVDDINEDVEAMKQEQLDYREKYIENIKNFGTKTQPKEDVENPKSLEEIAQEVLSKK